MPRFRFALGLSFEPRGYDTDGDGIPDATDPCPLEPGPNHPEKAPAAPRNHNLRHRDGRLDTTHTIFFKLQPGDSLVDAITAKLRECAIATGTLRAHGVLEHVELRTFTPSTKTLGASRALTGPLHALAIDGLIGLAQG